MIIILLLLALCPEGNLFLFHGPFHQQVFGTAVGCPVSVVVANLVMEGVEHRALTILASPPNYGTGTCMKMMYALQLPQQWSFITSSRLKRLSKILKERVDVLSMPVPGTEQM